MRNNESLLKAINSICACHDELINGDIEVDNRILSQLVDLINTFADDYYRLSTYEDE